ncbi:polymerase and histidinol phosphatase PHP [Alcanivorax hongdengensis A-11-3]|uniref:Polymerase and histidinol phosphatase PHP n=1 Tax=Alcanivorax hongdengensis A-11-3 TaxID=1177179 RepID=L0WBB8_9GAMM|nr:PHP domain-containing protein [Alcanivorax hongdengensis]EKF74063.1 polymerase and histidinol phosphatase PHP [Alcanivorax hongdengensis A-11-3]
MTVFNYQCPDLHSHSLASDGALSPSELVKRAADYGVTCLALTDHDTLAGLPEARAAASQHGIDLVNGIELSVRYETREIHVLGLWLDTDNGALQARVAAQREARVERARQIGRKLDRAAGLANSYERACELADDVAPGRPWFAKMLEQAGRVRNHRHAFNRFLKQGQSAYVSTPWCSLEEGIAAIREAGGIAVLAHPQAYGMTRKRLRQLMGAFKAAGGEGMELAMPGLTPQQQTLLNECWQHFDLAVSAGSDFHSPEQRWLALGRLPPLPSQARPVWAGR